MLSKWNVWIRQLLSNTHLSQHHTVVIHINENNSISHFEMENRNQIALISNMIRICPEDLYVKIISFQLIFQMQNIKSVHLIRVMVMRYYKINGFGLNGLKWRVSMVNGIRFDMFKWIFWHFRHAISTIERCTNGFYRRWLFRNLNTWTFTYTLNIVNTFIHFRHLYSCMLNNLWKINWNFMFGLVDMSMVSIRCRYPIIINVQELIVSLW